MPQHQAPLFHLGQTVATPAALRRLAWFEVTPAQLLDRDVSGALQAAEIAAGGLVESARGVR
jgi:hypothetical protein